MDASPGKLVPYRISRTGPKSVWLRELISRPHQNPPVGTTSGLLALLHGMLTNKTIVWDDFSWTDETTKAVSFMAAIADSRQVLQRSTISQKRALAFVAAINLKTSAPINVIVEEMTSIALPNATTIEM